MRNKLLRNILLGCFIALFLCILFNPILNVYGRHCREIDYAMLQDYVQSHKLNEEYAVVVDFSIHSGRHRFFLCDLRQKKIVASSLCAHGVGKGSTTRKPVFSNEVGSNCSCIGHFKITGKHKMSTSGLPSFKLIGLDKSNNNAARREILIHSARLLSKCRFGIYPFYLPLDKRISSGCFAISIDMMDRIEKIVEKEKKDILLWADCS